MIEGMFVHVVISGGRVASSCELEKGRGYLPLQGNPFVLSGIKGGLRLLMGLHQVDMPSHSFHQVVFFKSSSLYRRTGPIKVNCTTFHHFLQLSAADQDLHWALGLCFVCGKVKHRSECCSEVKSGPLFCSLLRDPYRMCYLFCRRCPFV